jgi:hypothetical protein
MDRELIERLALEAGIPLNPEELALVDAGQLTKFAALLAEECAQTAANTYEGGCPNGEDGDSGYDFNGDNSAEAIRARFPMPEEG